MLQRSEIIDPFFRLVYDRLTAELEIKIGGLAGGSAKVTENDTDTVAEKYAGQVAYIAAIRQVLEVCEELQLNMYGPKGRDDNQDGER
jgi:hypothetical protein